MAVKDVSQQNLLDDIKFWGDEYQQRVDDGSDDYVTPNILLRDFYSFCEQYIFYSEEVHQELVGVLDASSVHVRYRVAEVILEEWSAISRVIEQREQEGYREFLRDIEKRALRYLPKGVPGVVGYLGPASILRYQHYSSVSVASIPRDQLPARRTSVRGTVDFATAIPHEVGHHVWHLIVADRGAQTRYQLGKQTKEVVRKTLKKSDASFDITDSQIESIADLLDSWLAEAFADVYGAYVGGIPYADSIMKILHRQIGKEEDLFVNDGRHAFAYLRPLIRVKVLELQGHYDNAKRVRDEWKSFTRKLGVQDEQRDVNFLGFSEDKHEEMPRQAAMAFQITDPEGKAFSYGVPRAQEHFHQWSEEKAPLSALYAALDGVISDLLFPIAKNFFEGENQKESQFTFDRFKGYIDKQVDQYGFEALLLLLQPFSTLFGKVAIGSTGSNGGGVFVGSHTHAGSYHRHTTSGGIIVLSSA